MATEEPVEKLSDVLTSLQDFNGGGIGEMAKVEIDHQVAVLLELQEHMQAQLVLHDAQIAALREVIALLDGRDA